MQDPGEVLAAFDALEEADREDPDKVLDTSNIQSELLFSFVLESGVFSPF